MRASRISSVTPSAVRLKAVNFMSCPPISKTVSMSGSQNLIAAAWQVISSTAPSATMYPSARALSLLFRERSMRS